MKKTSLFAKRHFSSALIILAAMAFIVSCSGTGGDSTDTSAIPDSTVSQSADSSEQETVPAESTSPQESVEIKIATYNIFHSGNVRIDDIASMLKDVDADIVGLQEVDDMTTRSRGISQAKILAEKAGYPYWKFVKSIDFQGGGYGTAILSKYPISSFKMYRLESGSEEQRTVGHALISANGRMIHYFNTHLSFEELSLRTAQFEFIAQQASKCGEYIVTGDFNTNDYSEFAPFSGAKLVCNDQRTFCTFPGIEKAIDNIVYYGSFTEIGAGTVENNNSDHYLLWTVLRLDPLG